MTEVPSDSDDQVHALPSAAALVAATVALMTAYADPCCHCAGGVVQYHSLVARKVVSNLFYLQQHPGLSHELRQVMVQAHHHWVKVAAASASTPANVTKHAPQRALH